MASAGVLKPIINKEKTYKSLFRWANAPVAAKTTTNGELISKLTESNFFVESNAGGGFLGEHFLGVEEDTLLLLEGLLGLCLCMLRMICHLC